MRVLALGGGGREHALVWQMARFGHKLFAAPGNAGISRLAECVDIPASDIARLAEFAGHEHIDLTIAGPEAPLVAGIADEFKRRGLRLFGPSAAGARLEGDKAFAKWLMLETEIPTAGFDVFDDLAKAKAYLHGRRLPLVVKAAGLAAGKGVIICKTPVEAEQAVTEMLAGGRFGKAGKTVVVEDCLRGEEASLIALCDGTDFKLLISSQDHKRLRDNDEGPNTGGMGAYAPAPVVTPAVEKLVAEQVLAPLIAGLKKHGIDYRGVIYAGIMLTASGPSVLEFNCRFGDPETQAIMPLLQTDLAELALACVEGRLGQQEIRWSSGSALCVVAAAAGYPEEYKKGMPLSGDLYGSGDAVVFHAGTRREGEQVVTSGGRVLGITGMGSSLASAHDRAYAATGRVSFDGMFYRHDIGARGLQRAG